MRIGTHRALRPLAVAGVLVAVASATALGSSTLRPGPRAATTDTNHFLPSLVKVDATGVSGRGEAWSSTGYGAVIDPSGLILVNAHVAAPDAPGLSVRHGFSGKLATASQITVSIAPPGGQPQPAYLASTLAADGYLDLAVIKIDRDLNGGAVTPPPLTPVPLADLSTVAVGSPLTLVTYAGGAFGVTLSQRTGAVKELLPDERVQGLPFALIRTDQPWAGAESGGLALDANGSLIGLPTKSPQYTPEALDIVPNTLAALLIQAAQTGGTYQSPYVVVGTGQSQLQFRAWWQEGEPDPCAQPPTQPRTSYPTGATGMFPAWAHSGWTEGEDFVSYWMDGETREFLGWIPNRWVAANAPEGGCILTGVRLTSGAGFPDGVYSTLVLGGPYLQQVSEVATVGVGREPNPNPTPTAPPPPTPSAATPAPTGGATPEPTATPAPTPAPTPAGDLTRILARVRDADSGQPVDALTMFVIRPGVDLNAWLQNPLKSDVLSQPVTDASGIAIADPLPSGQRYGVIFFKQGYRITGGYLDATPGDFGIDVQVSRAQ